MANILNSFRSGAVGFIDWLDVLDHLELSSHLRAIFETRCVEKDESNQPNRLKQNLKHDANPMPVRRSEKHKQGIAAIVSRIPDWFAYEM